MASPFPKALATEINALTRYLVKAGLADDQNTAYVEETNRRYPSVRYHSQLPFPKVLKDITYRELYDEQRAAQSYNLRMLDGALIQMTYEFDGRALKKHRLCFLPSPDLESFQNASELYMEEQLYAEAVQRQIVTVPLRFDFDASEGVAKDLEHPVSHLTLGQYKDCRVPAVGALTPSLFMEFVLRSFYTTGASLHVGRWPQYRHRFETTITTREREVIHVGVPGSGEPTGRLNAVRQGSAAEAQPPARRRRRRP